VSVVKNKFLKGRLAPCVDSCEEEHNVSPRLLCRWVSVVKSRFMKSRHTPGVDSCEEDLEHDVIKSAALVRVGVVKNRFFKKGRLAWG
jgi:hypothetical protein